MNVMNCLRDSFLRNTTHRQTCTVQLKNLLGQVNANG